MAVINNLLLNDHQIIINGTRQKFAQKITSLLYFNFIVNFNILLIESIGMFSMLNLSFDI